MPNVGVAVLEATIGWFSQISTALCQRKAPILRWNFKSDRWAEWNEGMQINLEQKNFTAIQYPDEANQILNQILVEEGNEFFVKEIEKCV